MQSQSKHAMFTVPVWPKATPLQPDVTPMPSDPPASKAQDTSFLLLPILFLGSAHSARGQRLSKCDVPQIGISFPDACPRVSTQTSPWHLELKPDCMNQSFTQRVPLQPVPLLPVLLRLWPSPADWPADSSQTRVPEHARGCSSGGRKSFLGGATGPAVIMPSVLQEQWSLQRGLPHSSPRQLAPAESPTAPYTGSAHGGLHATSLDAETSV